MNPSTHIKIIRRDYTGNQVIGSLFVLDKDDCILFECVTLELPWRENAKRISCIPKGTYTAQPRVSDKYGRHMHILNVPNRDFILIHEANYVHQLQGCIAIGAKVADINGDGMMDITSSKLTKARFMEFMDGKIKLTIS